MDIEKTEIKCSFGSQCTKTSRTDKFFNEIEHICEDCQADKIYEEKQKERENFTSTSAVKPLLQSDSSVYANLALNTSDSSKPVLELVPIEKLANEEEVEIVEIVKPVDIKEAGSEIDLSAVVAENLVILRQINNHNLDNSLVKLFTDGANSITINGVNYLYIENKGKPFSLFILP